MSAIPSLDLSACRAKATHAREQLDALRAETDKVHKAHSAYGIRCGRIDKKTGWTSVYIVAQDPPKSSLGLYAGDVMYNLRCALDRVVAQLATACDAPIKNQQFPVYDEAERYLGDLGTPSAPKAKSRLLAGITHGPALELIESLQPYHRAGDAHADPLWHMYMFSSTDKHGEIVFDQSRVKRIQLHVKAGTVAEVWKNPEPPSWPPRPEHEFRRIRLAEPFPAKVSVECSIATQPRFVVAPAASGAPGASGDAQASAPLCALGLAEIGACCDHVDSIIGRFEQL